MTTHKQFTPGPWELSEGNTSIWARSPLNARVRIADIKPSSSPMNGIDYNANARLIAAAPLMYAELVRAEEILRINDFTDHADRIAALLKAADGGTQ